MHCHFLEQLNANVHIHNVLIYNNEQLNHDEVVNHTQHTEIEHRQILCCYVFLKLILTDRQHIENYQKASISINSHNKYCSQVVPYFSRYFKPGAFKEFLFQKVRRFSKSCSSCVEFMRAKQVIIPKVIAEKCR